MADFGQAARWLEGRRPVQRRTWEAKGIWLFMAPRGTTTLPCILVQRSDGNTAPWMACHNDLLAQDWQALADGEGSHG